MDKFSLRMQRPLMNPNKIIPDQLITFDFDGKIFYIKPFEDKSYFEYLNKDFTLGEKFYFKDFPGTQYFGIYITQTGKYMLDLANCKMYEPTHPFVDAADVDAFVKQNLKNECVQDFPQRPLFERFSADYTSYKAICEAVVSRDEEDFKNSNVCQPDAE
ncbi:hypothetical protein SS50377_20399 [Spironucleus salmonicida]|uniref:Uncharacterized protein n=1 Tax=Spironucleus salmonicida TaxID=348837 RepID=V6M4F2_9EUKA|nr:hypothetical protein SS50377_20399 [Spironucleus salmonicida]|eukprot:EST48194.1 Hypothetical protein SS50377_11632 [Spironucleus salmonicida]